MLLSYSQRSAAFRSVFSLLLVLCLLLLPGCQAAAPAAEGNNVSTPAPAAEDDSVSTPAPADESDRVSTLAAAALSEETSMVYPDRADYVDADTGKTDTEAYQAAESAYMDWYAQQKAQRQELSDQSPQLSSFYASILPALLADSGEENTLCSPLSAYFAFSVLAELTDGTSRQQLLSLLGASDVDTLRTQVSTLWKLNYAAGDGTNCLFSTSLWLDQDQPFQQSTLDTIAQSYYASTYQGAMGTEAMDSSLQSWLNAQTSNQLTQAVANLTTDPDDDLLLASTIDFHAQWVSTFDPADTASDSFSAPSGSLTCAYLRQTLEDGSYYQGTHFSAVAQPLGDLAHTYQMCYLLPEEGTSPAELLSDPEVYQLLSAQNYDLATIHLSVPKFDVTTSLELEAPLRSLGVTDLFDGAQSDFTPLYGSDSGITSVLQSPTQAVHLSVDEEGCSAAAYTVGTIEAISGSELEVDFTLSRPFLFLLTSQEGDLLFAGIIYNPSGT
jgi:serpin B